MKIMSLRLWSLCFLMPTLVLAGQGLPYRWPQKSLPVQLFASNEVARALAGRELLSELFEQWQIYLPYSEKIHSEILWKDQLRNYDSLAKYRDGKNTVTINRQWPRNASPSALAITYVTGTVSKNRKFLDIDEADIIINGKNTPFSVSGEANAYDLPSVVLHEIGHFLGLNDDPKGRDAVMYPSLANGQMRRNVTPYDVDSLMAIYEGSSFGFMEEVETIVEHDSEEEDTKVIKIFQLLGRPGPI